MFAIKIRHEANIFDINMVTVDHCITLANF